MHISIYIYMFATRGYAIGKWECKSAVKSVEQVWSEILTKKKVSAGEAIFLPRDNRLDNSGEKKAVNDNNESR